MNPPKAVAALVSGGALGTPSSGTLTNCTGLPVAGSGTGAATFTDAGVLIGNGTDAIQVTTAGTSGQVLTSNGAGVDPTFQAAAGGFASGTVMLFKQTAAPTGWTKDVTAALNDSALRVITGTVGAQGGTAAFSTTFASRTPAGSITVDNHTLITTEIPSHPHVQQFVDNGASLTLSSSVGLARDSQNGGGIGAAAGTITSMPTSTAAAGGGGAHNHTGSFTGTAMDFAVKYNDVIIASKD